MRAATHRLFLLAALAGSALATGCGRNEPPPPPPAPPPAAAPSAPAPPAGPIIAPTAAVVPTDAQRNTGATIAAQGGGGGVAACNGCHGAQGEGMAPTGFPRIAGQSFAYLAHELESYADGSRKHPVMQPIAAAMSADQRAAAAAYFASLAPAGGTAMATPAAATASAAPAGTAASAAVAGASAPAAVNGGPLAASSAPFAATNPPAPARTAASGAAGGKAPRLVAVGDDARGIQACANCHGPGGIGSGELYPYLAGQHAAYLTATLGAWADGSRNNDPSGQMPLIAKALSADEVKALSAYYAAQPPRATAVASERLVAAGFTPAPAVTSGPQAATPAAGSGGQGPDQGAATTGGAQGAGGGGGSGSASNGNPQAATAAAQGAASAR